MYQANWCAVVSSRSGDRVFRSSRYGRYPEMAAQLAWIRLQQLLSLETLHVVTSGQVIHYTCSVVAVPMSAHDAVYRHQSMEDAAAARADSVEGDVLSNCKGYGRGQQLPEDVVEVLPEGGK